jgi:hypothetical protein
MCYLFLHLLALTFCISTLEALERYQKSGAPLKCKQCTSAQEKKERQAAAAKASSTDNQSNEEPITCAACEQLLPVSNFNMNQLSKKYGARCRHCVEKSILAEEQSRKSIRQSTLDEVKRKIKDLKGDVREKLKYKSQLSALEAEHVTGLKPVFMGRGRGSWRGRGRRGR